MNILATFQFSDLSPLEFLFLFSIFCNKNNNFSDSWLISIFSFSCACGSSPHSCCFFSTLVCVPLTIEQCEAPEILQAANVLYIQYMPEQCCVWILGQKFTDSLSCSQVPFTSLSADMSKICCSVSRSLTKFVKSSCTKHNVHKFGRCGDLMISKRALSFWN